ncbi:MAG: PAS domain S-box-containing protein [Lentimonas sp.]|jgi:PAS domain S-box-containing protein
MAELNIVEFIEPVDENTSLMGWDFKQVPACKKALEQAMLTGETTYTPSLRLMPRQVPQTGSYLFLSVYRHGVNTNTPEERRAALSGWVFMRVDPTLIFSADGANQPEIDFSVIEMSESEPGHTIYASSNNLQLHDSQKNQAIPPLRSSQTIDLGKKHMWIIAYHSSDQFASTSRREMYVATAVGPLITLMLAVLLISFRHAEKKAKALSIGMTAELSASVAQVVRLALVATSNAVIFTDTQRITTWVNAGFTRITGYSPQEIIGMSPGERLQCPSTNPETIQAMRTALNAGLGCKAEIINRKKSGEDFWYEMDIVPLHSPAGELTGFMALGLDITNRKKNELRLAEQAKRSERALNELNRAQAELKKM